MRSEHEPNDIIYNAPSEADAALILGDSGLRRIRHLMVSMVCDECGVKVLATRNAYDQSKALGQRVGRNVAVNCRACAAAVEGVMVAQLQDDEAVKALKSEMDSRN